MIKTLILIASLTLASPIMASFIVGGQKVKTGQWNNVVAISNPEGKIFCSGTAMSKTTITTAAHCLLGDDITNFVIYKVYPLFLAFDNPNKSYVEFIAEKFPEAMTEKIVEYQKRLSDDPELLAIEMGYEANYFETFKDSRVRYEHIVIQLYSMIFRQANYMFRIHVGNGAQGGNIIPLKHRIKDIDIDPYYFRHYALKAARATELNLMDILMDKEGNVMKRGMKLDKLTITLDQELPIESFIDSIKTEELSLMDVSSVRLVGFGRTVDRTLKEKDENYGIKREVTVNFIDFSEEYGSYITHIDNKGACNGDSGGAAFVQLISGEWRYLGVISSGMSFDGEQNMLTQETPGPCGSSKIANMITPANL